MRVYLIRHSFAVDAGRALPDESRFLSSLGRQVARAVARRLKADGHAFDAMLTSPLVRAVQTAELLAEGMDFIAPIEALPALAPDRPPRLVAEELRARGDAVACVGHEPTISGLGAFLMSRQSFPGLRPGSVALIEDGAPRWLFHSDTMDYAQLIVQDGWL